MAGQTTLAPDQSLDPAGQLDPWSNRQSAAPVAPEPDMSDSPFAARPATHREPVDSRKPVRYPVQPASKLMRENPRPGKLAPPDKVLPLTKPVASDGSQRAAGATGRATTVLGSLGVVLGVFLLFAWLLKRGLPKGAGMLPRDVVEVLGRTPLTKGHYVHLVRCGNKLLLVSISPAGAETLTEITDAIEIDRIAGICQQTRPNSATAGFRQVFQQLGDDPRTSRARRTSADRLDLSAFAGIGSGQPGDADA